MSPGRPTLPADEAAELTRLRAENEALQRKVTTLQETLDTVEGSIVVYDAERRFLFANRAYHEIFPYLPPEEQLVGERYEQVIARSLAAGMVESPAARRDPEAFLRQRAADMDARGSVPRDVLNRRPGREAHDPRTSRWFLIRSRRTPCGNDVTLRVDITALKQLQQQLQEAREAAETASRMKSQFLANISHELRTPLNAVVNFAQLIAEEIHGPLGAPQYRQYAQDVTEAGMQLLGLIHELLDLARAEAGRLTIREGVVDLAAIVASCCRLLAPEAQYAGVTLQPEVAPDLPMLRGDAGRLQQVLTNLLGNAIKFTARGGTVAVAATRMADGTVALAVHDTGVGIAADDLDRVMQPFEQAGAVADDPNPGLGLGLPLSRHLVELHGGSLTLQSRPDSGTIAQVTLPMERVIG